MKNHFSQYGLILFIIIGKSYSSFSQNVAINTSGNSAYTSAILDLSNQNTNSTFGLLPPYVSLTSLATFGLSGTAAQSNGIIVYNNGTSVAKGLYYWNNTLGTWIALGSTLGTTNYLARWTSSSALGIGVAQDNGSGVGISGAAITPKSMLDVNGGVAIGTYAGTTAAPANGMIVSGQIGAGNSAPNAKAIADFSNTSNFGVMLPSVTTATLPTVTAAQNGMIIYNSTIGCVEYVSGGVWSALGLSHGNTTYSYTGSMQTFSVPNCVTSLTITATGADGASADFAGGSGAIVTATVTVTPGHTLDIVVGGTGVDNLYGAGGGGGTYIWDAASTTNPLVIAGGGGGGGGSGATGLTGSTTIAANGSAKTGTNAGGGVAGNAGTGVASGGGGGGWKTVTGNPAAATTALGAGGVGEPSSFVGGAGSTGADEGGAGGYGGGGGGGSSTTAANWGGGGGGGGYNGGGGGFGTNAIAAEYGGAGGGSGYYNGASFVSPVTVTNTGTSDNNGSVTISY